MSLIDNMGLPIHESLPMVVDLLRRHGLHQRIRVIASGKLITPVNVAWALCAGADFVSSARGFMFALGVHSGVAVQSEHLSNRHNHSRQRTAKRTGRYRQNGAS